MTRFLRSKTLAGRILALALIASLAYAAYAVAAGTPSPGFGANGIAQLGATARVNAVAVQDDGRPVVAGYAGNNMLVQRVSAAGAPEPAFNAGPGVAFGVAIAPDGKIVVVGRNNPNTAIAQNGNMIVRRFNANGTLDTSFGSGGTVTLGGTQGNAVAVANDGKIVVGGAIKAADGFPRVLLIRLLSTGAPDTGFGSGGAAVVDQGRNSQAKGVAIQSDGKVVYAGDQVPELQAINALVGRVNANGSVDGGFGVVNGAYFYFHPKGGAASTFNAVAIDSAGRIVAAGADSQGTGGSHALFVRLNGAGAPDGGFGSGGISTPVAVRNYGGGDLVGANALTIAGGGEIVGAGNFKDSGLTFAALWALTPAGQPDAAVGTGGTVFVAPIEDGGEFNGIGTDPAGNLVAGGNDLAVFPPGPAGGFVGRFTGFGAVPRPPRPPIVITGAASSITASTATVRGTVNPRNQTTTYFVEFGTTSRYGSRSATKSLKAGSADVAVSVPVTGMRPGSTIHYRVTARNAAGTSNGSDRTLKTPSLRTSISGVARRIRFASVRTRGLLISVRVNGAASVSGSLVVSRSTARKLKLRSITLASGRITARRSGTVKPRLRFSSAARRALGRKHGTFSVTVQTVTSVGGKRVTTKKTTKLVS